MKVEADFSLDWLDGDGCGGGACGTMGPVQN